MGDIRIVGKLRPSTKHTCKLGYPGPDLYPSGTVVACGCGRRYVSEPRDARDRFGSLIYRYYEWRPLRFWEKVDG